MISFMQLYTLSATNHLSNESKELHLLNLTALVHLHLIFQTRMLLYPNWAW